MRYLEDTAAVDTMLVPHLRTCVVRVARSGERISFSISAVKGSLGFVVETLASGFFIFKPALSVAASKKKSRWISSQTVDGSLDGLLIRYREKPNSEHGG